MKTISIVYTWIIDHERRTAYRRLGRNRFIRRDADGALDVVNALPPHVQRFVEQLENAQAA